MSAQRWTRRGKLSGPANVLDDRYEVVRRGTKWAVIDHPPGHPPEVIITGERSMRVAKEAAEWAARRGR